MKHSKLAKASGIFRIDVTTKREYIFTQKSLKEKLGIKGNIKSMQLWEGRSPKDEEEGLSPDGDKYIIETDEVTPNSSHN